MPATHSYGRLNFEQLWQEAVKLEAYLNDTAVPLSVRQGRLLEYEAMLDELAWREEAGLGVSRRPA